MNTEDSARAAAISDTPLIGVLGGTGDQGRGLALRFAAAGHRVMIGSRDADRASRIADDLNARVATSAVIAAGSNDDVAARADTLVIAVPWSGHDTLLQEIRLRVRGKIVIDCVNPLGFDERGAFALSVSAGSACESAAQLLEDAIVVGAFHHVSATLLLDLDVPSIDTDVLVVGDDRVATDLVQALADSIPGMRGVYAGRLRNAHQIEALTANLLSINRRYKAHAGVRVTDVLDQPDGK